VLLLKQTSLEDAFIIAERLRVAISDETFDVVGNITVSIGISTWSISDGISIEKTLSLADKALYQAKEQGRNRCIIA